MSANRARRGARAARLRSVTTRATFLLPERDGLIRSSVPARVGSTTGRLIASTRRRQASDPDQRQALSRGIFDRLLRLRVRQDVLRRHHHLRSVRRDQVRERVRLRPGTCVRAANEPTAVMRCGDGSGQLRGAHVQLDRQHLRPILPNADHRNDVQRLPVDRKGSIRKLAVGLRLGPMPGHARDSIMWPLLSGDVSCRSRVSGRNVERFPGQLRRAEWRARPVRYRASSGTLPG
jgi:hypothetical protein